MEGKMEVDFQFHAFLAWY